MIDTIFDMETSDPDDALTLCLLLDHPAICLRAVTITPGSQEQVAVVKKIISLFGKDIPVQMCNFHQVAIVRRYLTKKPKMQASKELWEHTLLLVHTDKESFEGAV